MIARRGGLEAPFPYFGGKRRVAAEIWRRLGDVENYVEPFFGSGAVLLGRPADHTGWTETANDACGYVVNFWRAVRSDPAAVARWADWPVFESDLHARHAWLAGRGESLTERLEGDPEWYDARAAGWWCWCLSVALAKGPGIGRGPWRVVEGDDGVLRLLVSHGSSPGISRGIVRLSDDGGGVARKSLHAGGDIGAAIYDWMSALSDRLRRVRVTCGDWSRVCTPAVTTGNGLTGVLLDPPYSRSEREGRMYTVDHDVEADVVSWAVTHGDDPRLRVALCSYDNVDLSRYGWTAYRWVGCGYGTGRGGRGEKNRHRETVWFSPHCLSGARAGREPGTLWSWCEASELVCPGDD